MITFYLPTIASVAGFVSVLPLAIVLAIKVSE